MFLSMRNFPLFSYAKKKAEEHIINNIDWTG